MTSRPLPVLSATALRISFSSSLSSWPPMMIRARSLLLVPIRFALANGVPHDEFPDKNPPSPLRGLFGIMRHGLSLHHVAGLGSRLDGSLWDGGPESRSQGHGRCRAE